MKVKMELLLSTLVSIYAVLTFPTGYLILTAVLSLGAFIFTESHFSVLGVLIIMTVLRFLNLVLNTTVEPSKYGAVAGPIGGKIVAAEGFQQKDPVSIHQRIKDNRSDAPLNPKVENIQGVLEAPSILNSLQISQMDPSERGGAAQTLPAMVGVTEPIRTPMEGFVPNVPSPDNGAPRGNPFLQNGGDDESITTALNKNAAINGIGVSGNVAGATPSAPAPY
jgi:hypothetical protein